MTTKTRESIIDRLQIHLSGEGTLNDNDTDALYREWHGIGDKAQTDLEAVERWAVNLLTGK